MKKNYKLSAKQIRCYGAYLREQERADSTVQKYLHDLAALLAYLRGRALTKAVLLEWKGDLAGRYAPASVNTMLAAVNGFLRFMGWGELTVRFLKIQKALFCDERRELTRADYVRLVNTARRKRKERLSWCSRPSAPPEFGSLNCVRSPQRPWPLAGRRLPTRENGAAFSCRKSCAVC